MADFGIALGISRAPFFDLLDADVQRTVEEAIAVLAKMTKGAKDVSLPSTGNLSLNAEAYAYHEESFTHGAGRYQIPTRRSLQSSANSKAADYVRSRWKLELIRRTIDDAFTDFDAVVLPTRRHTPRTVDASIQREETDKPEIQNWRIPGSSTSTAFRQSPFHADSHRLACRLV